MRRVWSFGGHSNPSSANHPRGITQRVGRDGDELTFDERLAFDRAYREAHSRLAKRLEAWESEHTPIEAGDDSFGDLVSHLVGLGREEYTATFADPERAASRARARDYVKSFAYVLLAMDAGASSIVKS